MVLHFILKGLLSVFLFYFLIQSKYVLINNCIIN